MLHHWLERLGVASVDLRGMSAGGYEWTTFLMAGCLKRRSEQCILTAAKGWFKGDRGREGRKQRI